MKIYIVIKEISSLRNGRGIPRYEAYSLYADAENAAKSFVAKKPQDHIWIEECELFLEKPE